MGDEVSTHTPPYTQTHTYTLQTYTHSHTITHIQIAKIQKISQIHIYTVSIKIQ